ncbi:hypothetical protein Q3C01_32610 [Bradyrhizobium sp. UFLA05-109]
MKAVGLIAAIIILLLVGFILGQSYQIGALQKIFGTPAAAAALIAAVFALVSGVGGPVASYLIGSRQADIAARQASAAKVSADAASATALSAGDRALANVRLSWLQSLRDNLSEYHSILMSAQDPHDKLDKGTRFCFENADSKKAFALICENLGVQYTDAKEPA